MVCIPLRQGHLMKQSKFFSKWKPRYFRLENGFLTYYDKKALVGTPKHKVGDSEPTLCISMRSY